MSEGNGLGLRQPIDTRHIEKYPLRSATRDVATSTALTDRGGTWIMSLPSGYRSAYDQGSEGACVGYSLSWALSILNRKRYDADWLYRAAQLIDDWPDTPPASGTSVRAGCDVLRDSGPRRPGETFNRSEEGIASNYWASSVDDIRNAIASNYPVVLGINWYLAFDTPERFDNAMWIGAYRKSPKRGGSIAAAEKLGPVRGGHAICCYGADDERQAFKLANTWGLRYPLVWVPYEIVGRLLRENGEAAVLIDR